jgi:hypothetical protein
LRRQRFAIPVRDGGVDVLECRIDVLTLNAGGMGGRDEKIKNMGGILGILLAKNGDVDSFIDSKQASKAGRHTSFGNRSSTHSLTLEPLKALKLRQRPNGQRAEEKRRVRRE